MMLVVTETMDHYDECVHAVDVSHVSSLGELNATTVEIVTRKIDFEWGGDDESFWEWIDTNGLTASNFSLSNRNSVGFRRITEFFKFINLWNVTHSGIHEITFKICY